MPTVPELFESVVARAGDDSAVVFRSRVVTYAQLNARANRLAHALVMRGVGPDAIVAVAMPKSDELMVVLLAVLKAGGPIHFAETLMLQGLRPSIGTVGDAYDNALAETTIGLYKTECIRDDSPFRRGPLQTVADVEKITSEWVYWYNTARLMHRLGRRPPAEAEAEYWAAVAVTREPSR